MMLGGRCSIVRSPPSPGSCNTLLVRRTLSDSQTRRAPRVRLQLHRQFDSSAARYRLFGLAQATFLVLAPAAAGARVVAPGRGPDLSVAPTHKLHHKGGRLAPPPERDHFLHIRVDMIKEVPVPLAKVIEARLAVRR